MDLIQHIRHRGRINGAVRAAQSIIPLLYGLFKPTSVLDLGCGDGAFSLEFIQRGCKVRAFDKSKPALLPSDAWDSIELTAPYNFTAFYDLALCLEVAEHLPAGRVTTELIRNLCSAAPVVVFSAAIPLQGGSGHVNEHWQSHWADLFAAHHYLPCAVIRDYLWSLPDVPPWYAQNTLVYAKAATLDFYQLKPCSRLDVVHPNTWLHIGPLGYFKRLCSLLQSSSPSRSPLPC